MSLLAEARGLAKPSGGTCGVRKLNLDPAELVELEEALATDISMQALSDALKARGHVISAETLRRHRGGRCACRS